MVYFSLMVASCRTDRFALYFLNIMLRDDFKFSKPGEGIKKDILITGKMRCLPIKSKEYSGSLTRLMDSKRKFFILILIALM